MMFADRPETAPALPALPSFAGLAALAALSRVVPHPPNMALVGAASFYAGARLPARWALAVPLVAMLATDLAMDYRDGRPALSVMRLAVYASFLIMVGLGRLGRGRSNPAILGGLALVGSTVFYLSTNYVIWWGGAMYPRTPIGLYSSYAAGVPFFGNTIVGDLGGLAALLGLEALARRAGLLGPARPAAGVVAAK